MNETNRPADGDPAPTNAPSDPQRDEREYATQSPPDQPPPVADEKARRIAEQSPEGIPADPDTNQQTIGRLLFVAVVLILAVALAVAVFGNRWLGLGVGVLALFLLLVNPVLWAAILRAKERDS